MTITNELFVRSFDKDTAEDEEAFAFVLFRLVCRDRIRIASKILSDYQGCDEYTPRTKKSSGSLSQAPEQPADEMKIETITEEATKVVMTGTHDYPSAPGSSNWLKSYAGVPLSAENATRTEPTKSTIDLAVKSIKEKERQQK